MAGRKVTFSRHATRRAKLYGIDPAVVEQKLQDANLNLIAGEQTMIADIPDMKYPLKIVFTLEGDIVTVITNYPLKKGIVA